MDFNEFSKILKNDKLSGAYILHGEEEYIKDLAISAIMDKYIPEGLKDLNYAKLDGSECEAEDILQAAQPLPVMSERRVVVLNSYPLGTMTAAKLKSAQNASQLERFSEILKTCPPETIILVVVRGRSSAAFQKSAADSEHVVEFKHPQPAQKIQYVSRMAKEAGLKISDAVIRELIDYTSLELLGLSSEVLKLKAYLGDGEATDKDIRAVCQAAAEYNIFKMLRYIADKKSAKALGEYRRLIESGQSPQAVISMIERQYRALFYMDEIKGMSAASQKDTADKLQTKDFVLRNMVSLSKRLDKETIANITKWCADADYLVKRGNMSIEDSAELLIIRLISVLS